MNPNRNVGAGRFDLAMRRTTVFVLASFLVLVGSASTWNIVRQYSQPKFWTDFTGDYVSARAHLDGDDPYGSLSRLEHRYVTPSGNPPVGITANPHPPAYVDLAIPVARLGYSTARTVWLSVMTLSFVIGLALALREMGLQWIWAFSIAIGCLWLRISRISLLTAQIDGILLLLIVLGWISFRRGRDRGAGIALGAAAALKFFPLFLIIPVLRARRWQTAMWQIGSMIALTIGTSALLGTSAVWAFVTRAAPENLRNWAGAPHNLSLTAIPLRWLTINRWRPEALDLRLLAIPLVLVVFLMCAIAAWRTPARLSGDPFLAAIPWMLLATPLFWPHELVLALPLIATVALRHGIHGITDRPWPILAAAVLVLGSPHGYLNIPIAAWYQVFIWMAATYALLAIASGEWTSTTVPLTSDGTATWLPSLVRPSSPSVPLPSSRAPRL
jgi:hypothetical protein